MSLHTVREYFQFTLDDKGEPANTVEDVFHYLPRKLWLKRVTGQTFTLATNGGRVLISYLFIILLAISIETQQDLSK